MTKLILALLLAANAQASLKIGDPLPESATKMKNTDGRELTLDELSKDKKGTLVVFSCNTCPYAKAWKDRIVEIGKDAEKRGLGVVMINSNDSVKYKGDDMASMITAGIPFPYVVDATSNVARSFGATKTPDVFLFGKDKKLVYKGAVDDNSDDPNGVKEHYLKTAVAQLLEGKPVKPAETKSVGCGIKFREPVAAAGTTPKKK
ncbi:MAG TPA: thioredoxin family protein [Bdellovibrionales bacterium]|nr:thioredoxin family protein [Bdellovibrionales bacterium]